MMTILNMGGYGMYVWPSYGLMILVFGINLWHFFQEKKHVKRKLIHYFKKSL